MRTPVEIALGELGVHEFTGKNDGIPAKRYMKGDALAWCAGFVLWCFEQSDWPSLYDDEDDGQEDRDDLLRYYDHRAVQGLEDTLRDEGKLIGHELRELVEPGDLIFYKNRGRSDPSPGGRHIGIVEFVESPAMVVHTVEGNLGNAVKKRIVQPGDKTVAWFGRWR